MDSALIIIFVSIVIFASGIILWQKSTRLRMKGKRCIGTIIRNNYKISGYYHPVIRFVTEDKLWITEELKVGFKPARQEGKSVKIIYNAEDPQDFQLDSIFLIDILPRLMVALGLTGIAYGLMKYLGYI